MLKLYSIGDMADACKVSAATVRRWIDRGELAAVHVGSMIRITEEEIYSFIGLPLPDPYLAKGTAEYTHEEIVAFALRQAKINKRNLKARNGRRPCTRKIARRTRELIASSSISSAPGPDR
jgi:excisionase family DNA binding protein